MATRHGARRYGAHDEAGAGRVLSNSVMVGLVAAIVGGVVAFVTAEPMSSFFAESSEAQAHLASSYAKIRAFGLGGTVLIFSFKAFFDGLGRTHLHLIASMAMTLFNIALNFRDVLIHLVLNVIELALSILSFVGEHDDG